MTGHCRPDTFSFVKTHRTPPLPSPSWPSFLFVDYCFFSLNCGRIRLGPRPASLSLFLYWCNQPKPKTMESHSLGIPICMTPLSFPRSSTILRVPGWLLIIFVVSRWLSLQRIFPLEEMSFDSPPKQKEKIPPNVPLWVRVLPNSLHSPTPTSIWLLFWFSKPWSSSLAKAPSPSLFSMGHVSSPQATEPAIAIAKSPPGACNGLMGSRVTMNWCHGGRFCEEKGQTAGCRGMAAAHVSFLLLALI